MLWTLKKDKETLKKDKETPAFPSQYLSFIKLVGDTGSSAAETAKTGHMLVTMHVLVVGR